MKQWHVLCVQVSAKAFQSLYTLLGFNENERRFTTMPYRIRCTPAINAFMTNLPQVLDNNFAIGKLILLNTVLILQKIPFPPRYATTWQHAYTLMQEKYLFQVNFSQISTKIICDNYLSPWWVEFEFELDLIVYKEIQNYLQKLTK